MKRHQLAMKRVFKMAKRELFDAWSQPEIMQRWFFASRDASACCTVENQFTIDGVFKLVMSDRGTDHVIDGKYIEIVRYNYIAFTWNSPVVTDTLVTLEFRELSANRTEMILRHQFLPSSESSVMHQQGWAACLDNLESLVASIADPALS